MTDWRDDVARAWNQGESNYRVRVLGQSPLPGYPVEPETMTTETATQTEGQALTFEEEVHALLWKGLTYTRDLLSIFERERPSPEERSLHDKVMIGVAADIDRFKAIIPRALEWRDKGNKPDQLHARNGWAGISTVEADRIARVAVAMLSDAEPNEDTLEAQERLKGTPQEHLYCVDAPTIERAISVAIQNATYDALHFGEGNTPTASNQRDGYIRTHVWATAHDDANCMHCHEQRGTKVLCVERKVRRVRNQPTEASSQSEDATGWEACPCMDNLPCDKHFPSCRGCYRPLDPALTNVADGCPCNSPRGINHGLVPTHVCTCTECDPAQTGSVRTPTGRAAPNADAGRTDAAKPWIE